MKNKIIKILKKIRDKYNVIIANIRRKSLKNVNFSIISNNCWGGLVYKNYNLKYLTPTVGLFIMADDYIKLIYNLKFYLSNNIKFIEAEESKYKNILKNDKAFGKYPIGILNNEIEIHFLHYKSQREAEEKWKKRVNRINYDNIIIKFCDRINVCLSTLNYLVS